MLRLLCARPGFRRLFGAHAISRAGDAFNTVALVVLVFNLTGSGVGVAGAVMLEVLPLLVLAPVAGLVADRFPRRRVMIGADLWRAGCAAGLALGAGSVAIAYLATFGLAVGAVFFNPASSSLVPELVGEDELVTANSALWTVAVSAQILLAPVAGLVIATVGAPTAFAINAATFLASAAVLAGMAAGGTPAAIAVSGWSAMVAGLRIVRRSAFLRRLALVQLLASLSAGASGGLLVVLAERWLGVGAGGFGLLLAAIGLGALTGPVLLRRFVTPASISWLFGPFAVRGGVDLVLAAVPSATVAGVGLVAYGMSTSTGMIAYQSTLQVTVSTEVRGRVFALYDVVWNAARLVSLALGGIAVELLGVRAIYVISGLLLLAAAGVGLGSRIRPDTNLG